MPTDTVSEYVDSREGETHIRVVREHADALVAALLHDEACEELNLGGRGGVLRLSLGDSAAIIRTYRRGGLMQHLLRESYLFENRPLREFDILCRAYESGLPVPQPLGICWTRRAGFFRGRIATREIVGIDLKSKLENDPKEAFEVLEQCGAVIRRFHDEGFWHADLQVGNILVSDSKIWLIDFDNATWEDSITDLARARNLLRFRRSLEKHGFPQTYFGAALEGYGAIKIPGWLDLLYQMRGRRNSRVATTPYFVYCTTTVNQADVSSAVDDEGIILKQSSKWLTKRVGNWALKTEGTKTGTTLLFLRGTGQRDALFAAQKLIEQGVRVPTPVAYLEYRSRFRLERSVYVAEFLDGWQNVETFARSLANDGADKETCREYLAILAGEVNKLVATGAYHRDLSGKNIFTQSGKEFCFIDLDSVILPSTYDRACRMKNHIQLYDSFCDVWGPELLRPFIEAMEEQASPGWFEEVVTGQQKRRARQEELWKRQGKRE